MFRFPISRKDPPHARALRLADTIPGEVREFKMDPMGRPLDWFGASKAKLPRRNSVAKRVSRVLATAKELPRDRRNTLFVELPAVHSVRQLALSAQFRAVRPMPPEPAWISKLEEVECIIDAAMLSASSVVVQMVTKPAASLKDTLGLISHTSLATQSINCVVQPGMRPATFRPGSMEDCNLEFLHTIPEKSVPTAPPAEELFDIAPISNRTSRKLRPTAITMTSSVPWWILLP
jgi:hypothetical protein